MNEAIGKSINFCTSCGEPIQAGAQFCTACGASAIPGDRDGRASNRRTALIATSVIATVVVLAAIAVVFLRSSGNQSSAPRPTPSPTMSTSPPSAPTATATRYFVTPTMPGKPTIAVGAEVDGNLVNGWGEAVGVNWGFCFKGTMDNGLLAGRVYEGTGGEIETFPFEWKVAGAGTTFTLLELNAPLSAGAQELIATSTVGMNSVFTSIGGVSERELKAKIASCKSTLALDKRG